MSSARQLLETLVGFPTVSRDSNLALIAFIEGYLGEHGVPFERIESDDGSKANLLARIGPEVTGGVVLSGHTDVVPVDGQPWSTNPFTLIEKDDNRLYGRGTCDMKGFIACALAQVPSWVELELQKPIYLAFSYDEEIGCLGAPRLIERLMANHPRPGAVIVGEPTMMEPVVAHKGSTNFRTHVTGKAAHSSQIDQGVSAIHVAARLVTHIEDIMADLKREGRIDNAFNVAHSSLHVGKIQGGTAINITARECEFDWEIRHLPQDSVEELRQRVDNYAGELEEEMQRRGPNTGIRTGALSKTVPALADRDNSEALSLCRELLRRKLLCDELSAQQVEDEKKPGAVAYATEAGQFQGVGLPTVICGPGSIAQAHQPDEYLDIAQLEAGTDFMRALGEQLSKR